MSHTVVMAYNVPAIVASRGVRPSVRPSVCVSHPASLSKRCKLGSRKLYCRLSERL